MAKGDKFTIEGDDRAWEVVWSSDEMTDEQRYESHMRTADYMERYGLSGDFQRAMAEKYRPSPD